MKKILLEFTEKRGNGWYVPLSGVEIEEIMYFLNENIRSTGFSIKPNPITKNNLYKEFHDKNSVVTAWKSESNIGYASLCKYSEDVNMFRIMMWGFGEHASTTDDVIFSFIRDFIKTTGIKFYNTEYDYGAENLMSMLFARCEQYNLLIKEDSKLGYVWDII